MIVDHRPCSWHRHGVDDVKVAALGFICPFFIIDDLPRSLAFYRDQLGFEVEYTGPPDDPFFGMVRRDQVHLMVKVIVPEVHPLPNARRHPWASWDAYVYTPDPDALAAELGARGVAFHKAIHDRDDGLRGFEIEDPDGYVLFFGRPR